MLVAPPTVTTGLQLMLTKAVCTIVDVVKVYSPLVDGAVTPLKDRVRLLGVAHLIVTATVVGGDLKIVSTTPGVRVNIGPVRELRPVASELSASTPDTATHYLKAVVEQALA